MLRRIEPEKIICYNTPFPEMQGNIIYVDYERSFRVKIWTPLKSVAHRVVIVIQ